jgi:hypothetical protein
VPDEHCKRPITAPASLTTLPASLRTLRDANAGKGTQAGKNLIIRFRSDRNTRLWFIGADAYVLAAGDSAALVLADRPLTAEACDELATVLTETAAFLKGHSP